MTVTQFTPSITVYSCAYCGAVPREMAAIERIPYPPEAHIVEFPCISRVQSDVILAAFEAGADGVLLVACEEGNCHHQGGNRRTLQRLEAMHALLAEIGIGAERLGLWQGGLGQPTAFVEQLEGFVESIKQLGASPLNRGERAGD